MSLFRRFPFHPFLLAIYSALALLAYNIREVNVSVAVRPLFFSLALALALLGILRLAFKHWLPAALAASLILILFFSYGHLYEFLKANPVFGMQLGRYRLLAPLYLVFMGLGLWWVAGRKSNLSQLTFFLNILAAFLLLFPLVQMGGYAVQQAASQKKLQANPKENGQIVSAAAQNEPDIYYIILDSYTRADVLQKDFGYDNSHFIDSLRRMGFYVADCSLTNYPATEISLSSSLNMAYLQDIAQSLPAGTNLGSVIISLLKHSQVRTQLESIGYKTVAFATGYDWIEWKDASLYLEPEFNLLSFKEMRPFEAMFIKSTAAVAAFDIQQLFPQGPAEIDTISYQDHIKREFFLLNQLDIMPTIPGPKFVYAHILIPHGPFVFGADGKALADPSIYENADLAAWKQGYTDEVQFINGHLLSILPGLIANSRIPPIIIIQGDHGSKVNRFPILNAYYLPGAGKEKLYSTISPVNSFRLIFDTFFGAHYNLLQDVPYDPKDVQHGQFTSVGQADLPTCPVK
jgi:hypothetical protein